MARARSSKTATLTHSVAQRVSMCVVRDELLLLSMLVVQCVAGLPVMALMKLCGVAYALLFVFGFGISVSVAFAPYLRWCCSSFKYFVNEFGICLFWMTHVALLSLSSYTLYIFLLPFVKSDNFMTFCVKHKLYSNLTKTGCDSLQGLYALSLVSLTIANLASSYLLLLGSRITRRNWSDAPHELLKNEDTA